jgi:hypothetical protein
MNSLKKRLLNLVDETAVQAKGIIDDFNTMIDDINWENHITTASEFVREKKKVLTVKANDLLSDLSDLVKEIKNNLTDFTATVAFDEDGGEEMTHEVITDESTNASKLVVKVSYTDETTSRENMTSVTIPKECSLDYTVSVNKQAKTATFTFPKLLNDDTLNEETEEMSVTEEPQNEESTTVKRKAKQRAKINFREDQGNDAHVSSKLAQKLSQNVAKARLNRDSHGRFVRRQDVN